MLTLIAEQSARGSLERVIGRQLAREAGHSAEQLSTELRAERDTLGAFARQDLMRDVRVADIDKRVAMALAILRGGSPVRLDYLVVDPGGRVVAASDPGLIGPLPEWADKRWATSGEPGLAGPLVPSGGGASTFVMSTPIHDPDDGRRVLGTLVGLFDWERLTDVTERVRRDLASQGIAADVLLSRPDGSVIRGARSSKSRNSAQQAGLAAVASASLAGEPDYAVAEAAGLIIGRAALGADLPDWRLLVVEPRAHALAPAQRLSRHLILTMGFALVGALGLATLAARRVVQPLSELTRAIRGLPRGETTTGSVPVRSEDEVGTLAVAFNEMAAELDQAQRHLVEAEKFAFVGELAAGVAHEIRTALGVLRTSAQMLERSLPRDSGAEATELAQMIRAEVDRLAGVANDLLTLDRARPLHLERVRISEPVLRAVDFVAPQARQRGIRIVPSPAANEPWVSCEPELMYQVAINLLVNALQALASGGCIEVRVEDEADGYGGFEVRDDGPGIPATHRERVFQPFVTARPGGIGLGLTYVKRVVHDHHGQVTLESDAGSGTRVRIRIPVADDR